MDIFDAWLFNFVAPIAIPSLLGFEDRTSKEAVAATIDWTGILTCLLLIGWCAGGIVFGYVADRFGRVRTMQITVLLFSVATASCAIVPNIWLLVLSRIAVSLGVGGEWTSGVGLVSESVPDKRRVEAGAILQSAGPFGLGLAGILSYGVVLLPNSEYSWRIIMLVGLVPSIIALLVRCCVKEPDRWVKSSSQARVSVLMLFEREHRRATLVGLLLSIPALLLWWSNSAFIPTIAVGLALRQAAVESISEPMQRNALIESFKATATNIFNLG